MVPAAVSINTESKNHGLSVEGSVDYEFYDIQKYSPFQCTVSSALPRLCIKSFSHWTFILGKIFFVEKVPSEI